MSVERVGIAFEPDLLKKFDLLIRKKGYKSRSEAIRDLVRKSIIESDVASEKGDVLGTVTIVYDHEIHNVPDKLLHIQHRYQAEILATSHTHIDTRTCLEVLVVRGKHKIVKKLADSLIAVKGVKTGELVIAKT
jgi:CopG family nickel-responsive transcriptional regulator